VTIRADVALVERAGRLLLRRRQDEGLMRGLWELPTVTRRSVDGLRLEMSEPIATVRHSITYRRLELRVRTARLLSAPPRGRYRWVRRRDLGRLPASSMLRKVLAACGERRGRPAGPLV